MLKQAMIDKFLGLRHVAVVGVSRDATDFANSVFRQLRDHGRGRVLYPVNASAGGAEIEGTPSYESLADVPDPLDGVLVMVPAENSADIVRAALARGRPMIWLHKGMGPGAVSPEAVDLCHRSGLEVVEGACPMMFEEPVAAFHKIHRVFTRHRISA